MKITKRQLRRIIKEEKAKLIHESKSSFDHALEARDVVINNMKGGADEEEILQLLEELYPELRADWTAIINDASDLIEFGIR